MATEESDFEYAIRLHQEMNGALQPLIPEKDVNGNEFGSKVKIPNRRASFNGSVIILSDSDSETEATNTHRHARALAPASRSQRSRSPLIKSENVTFDNQQAITIKREKTTPNDYFMPIINTFIDLNNNTEWAMVFMESDVQMMFDKLKDVYWQMWLKDVNYTVKWDTTGVISDDSSFKIFESHKEILLNNSSIVRPRIQLVSVMLHILIHIYLSYCSKGALKMNNHDESFRQLMLFLNQTLSTDISASHKFIYSSDDNSYTSQWYQCTGICQSYKPFKGVVRSTTNPSEACAFWKGHEESCGGQFFKVFQMSRTNSESQQQEHKYVRNVHYMFPKPRQAQHKDKCRLKTNIQARELFDLTDDVAETATIKNLCDVINLDDSDYNPEALNTSTGFSLVNSFTSQKLEIFNKCPFCQIVVGTSCFKSHVDTCRGYQEKVVFTLKGKRGVN